MYIRERLSIWSESLYPAFDKNIFNRLQKERGSQFKVFVCMYIYVLCFSANFSVTTEPILVKLIAFSLASINLGHGERIIKIGQVILKLHQKIRNLFHYNTLYYARAGKGRSIRRRKNSARQNINASSVSYRSFLASSQQGIGRFQCIMLKVFINISETNKYPKPKFYIRGSLPFPPIPSKFHYSGWVIT